jgi:ethanolamine permease
VHIRNINAAFIRKPKSIFEGDRYMSESSGSHYTKVDQSYFDKRGLRRYAGVWSLWALGVGAVISGHFSGWNLGLSNGWGSMFLATVVIAIMYLGLTFSLA